MDKQTQKRKIRLDWILDENRRQGLKCLINFYPSLIPSLETLHLKPEQTLIPAGEYLKLLHVI